jgi:hypothetical protein
MAEEMGPPEPEPLDKEPDDKEPKAPDTPKDVPSKTWEDVLEEDRFESTDN